MSIANETPAMPRARDVREAAAAWLERRVAGEWSSADQAELDAWLAQSPSHMAAFLRVEAAWDRTYRLSVLRKPVGETDARETAWMFPMIAKIAAAAGVIAVIGIMGLHYFQPPQERTYSTRVGGHELVTFADGSRIELNTNTILRARMTTNERVVWLDRGEAYFEIKHDSAHPFVVMVGSHRVTDLGTKFRVRRDPGRLQVSVMQGRVTFDTPDQGKLSPLAVLTPGDVAVATAKTISVTRESAQALTDQLSWRKGVLVFDRTTLAEAAAEFNRYNRDKLVIADDSIARRAIGGTFPTDNLEAFIGVTQDLLGLHVKRNGHEIVISR